MPNPNAKLQICPIVCVDAVGHYKQHGQRIVVVSEVVLLKHVAVVVVVEKFLENLLFEDVLLVAWQYYYHSTVDSRVLLPWQLEKLRIDFVNYYCP